MVKRCPRCDSEDLVRQGNEYVCRNCLTFIPKDAVEEEPEEDGYEIRFEFRKK